MRRKKKHFWKHKRPCQNTKYDIKNVSIWLLTVDSALWCTVYYIVYTTEKLLLLCCLLERISTTEKLLYYILCYREYALQKNYYIILCDTENIHYRKAIIVCHAIERIYTTEKLLYYIV